VDFNIQVLTSGFWPTYPVVDVQLSEDLTAEEDAFKKFYLSKHSGRRLTWLHSLTGCVLKCDFPSGAKEISLTLYQALVMLLFNTQHTLTYTHISEQTSIPQVDLIRVLQSLSCAKLQILTKTTPGSKWKKTVNTALDTFSVNEEFSSPLFRLKIPMVQEKAVVEKEDASVRVKVFSDRQYAVDAAIVRVMKARKTLSHNLLISELIRMLDFNVEIPQLKARIESLIELEYLERDSNDPSVYKYLA
jgi:cullin-4